MTELQTRLFAESTRALLVVLQAMDAGGKDGMIRNVLTGLNPAGVDGRRLRRAERRGARPRLPVAGPPPARRRAGRSACSTAATTRTCSSCGSRARARGGVAPALPPHPRVRADARRRGHDGRQVLPARLQGRAAAAAAGPPRRPEKRWKFRRGDLDDRAAVADFMQAFRDALRATSHRGRAVVRRAGRPQVGAQPRRGARSCSTHLERLDPQFPPPEEGIEGLRRRRDDGVLERAGA